MSVYLVRSLLLSLFIAIFVTACYYFIREEVKSDSVAAFKKSLQSWSASFTLQASPTPFAGSGKSFKDAIEKNMQATTARLKAAGFSSEIKLNNDSCYTVDISRITDTVNISSLVAGSARLQFNEVYTSNDIASLFAGLKVDSLITFFRLAQPYKDEFDRQIFPAFLGVCKLADSARAWTFFSDSQTLSHFPEDIQFMFSEPESFPRESEQVLFLYAVRRNPDALFNKYITSAKAEYDGNEQVINFQFDAAGTKRWEKMTEKNIGKAIAISVNDKVLTAPTVVSAITGGNSRITMGSGPNNFETTRILSVLLASEDLLLPVQITGTRITQENLSPLDKLSPFFNYLIAFIAAFAISFCITWFIFKPGKNARAANP
jgi:preprotein translocase subunit SecD